MTPTFPRFGASGKAGPIQLAWETAYEDALRKDPISRDELRMRVLVRELIHEHLDLLFEVMAEYHLNPFRALKMDPANPSESRDSLVDFTNRIPSMRIAIDLKAELFRNQQKSWTNSAIQDIDAMSRAVPYCDAVLADAEISDWLLRSKFDKLYGITIVKGLQGLPVVLEPLIERAELLEGDETGWDWAGPGDGFLVGAAELDDALAKVL